MRYDSSSTDIVYNGASQVDGHGFHETFPTLHAFIYFDRHSAVQLEFHADKINNKLVSLKNQDLCHFLPSVCDGLIGQVLSKVLRFPGHDDIHPIRESEDGAGTAGSHSR